MRTIVLLALSAFALLVAAVIFAPPSTVPPATPQHTTTPPGYTLLQDAEGHTALRFDNCGGVILYHDLGAEWTRQSAIDHAWDDYDQGVHAEKQYREAMKEYSWKLREVK